MQLLKNLSLILATVNLAYADFAYADSKKDFRYKPPKSDPTPKTNPSSDTSSNQREAAQKAVQAEYLKHYLDAYLARQAEKDLDDKERSAREVSKDSPPKNSPSQAVAGPAKSKNAIAEKDSEFIEEFKNGIRIIRGNQARSNQEQSKASYTGDDNRTDNKAPAKEVWRG